MTASDPFFGVFGFRRRSEWITAKAILAAVDYVRLNPLSVEQAISIVASAASPNPEILSHISRNVPDPWSRWPHDPLLRYTVEVIHASVNRTRQIVIDSSDVTLIERERDLLSRPQEDAFGSLRRQSRELDAATSRIENSPRPLRDLASQLEALKALGAELSQLKQTLTGSENRLLQTEIAFVIVHQGLLSVRGITLPDFIGE